MSRYAELQEKFAALSARERIIIWAAGAVLLILGWYLVWGEPALATHTRLAKETAGLEMQLAGLNQQLQNQSQQSNTGVVQQQRQLEQVRQRNDEVQQRIDSYAAELISPTEMARLLEKVLERRPSLELRRLSNHGAEDLLPDDVPGERRLYRHRFEMELRGPYLELLAYLEDLESLPWRLYWQGIEIESDEYPENIIRIEVATLSLHEEWIGV